MSVARERLLAQDSCPAPRNEDGSDFVAQTTSQCAWEWNIATNELVWTKEIELLGYTPDDVVPTLGWWEAHIHPDDRDRVMAELFRSMARQNGHWTDEYRFSRKDGTYASVIDHGRLVRDEQGQPTHMVGAMIDCSALKLAEHNLGEARAFADAVLDTVPASVAVIDANGIIVRINDAWRAFADANGGTPESTGIGANYFDTCRRAQGTGSDGSAEALNGMLAILHGRQPAFELEYPCPSPFTERWFLMRCTRLPARLGLVCAHIDVSTLKRAQLRLHTLEEVDHLLAPFLDAVSSLIQVARYLVPDVVDFFIGDLIQETGVSRVVIAHKEETCERLALDIAARNRSSPGGSQAVAQVMQTKRLQVVEDPADLFLPSEPRQQAALRSKIDDLGLTFAVSIPLVARETVLGAVSFGSTTVRRRFDLEAQAFFSNIAERIAVAVDRARIYERLRRTDAAKHEFLALLAHEMRNPMAPIVNAVHLLRRKSGADTNLSRPLEIIEHQVAHQARLLEDILDVTRIARGKILLRKETLDLAALVRETLNDNELVLTQAGLTVIRELPEQPLWIEGDPTRLAQVIGNLLHNALKFSTTGGSVTVRLEADPVANQAILSVSDTGMGIAPDVAPQIFEPFTQANQDLSRERGGLGLGLALVKGLVEMHSGSVAAHSQGLGKGAQFVIRIPLQVRAQEIQPPREKGTARLPQTPKNMRILIIEDNRDAADTLHDLLALSGYEVHVAYTGPDGLDAARQFLPEVVLCDIGLPGMDGYEVARELRRSPTTAWMWLIAVSGYGQESDRIRSREAGFELHITKPIYPDDLERLLATLSRRMFEREPPKAANG